MKNAILSQLQKVNTNDYPSTQIPMKYWDWKYDQNGEVQYNNFKTLMNYLKFKSGAKLDKIIVNLLGEPGKMVEEPKEMSVNESINHFVNWFDNNKKSIVIWFIIISVLKVIEKSL